MGAFDSRTTWWAEKIDFARPDEPDSPYCECGEPTVGFWGLECSSCRRLIEGSIPRRLAR